MSRHGQDGWAARAAGKWLVGPDDVCLPTHRLKDDQARKLMKTEKYMQFTGDTARNQLVDTTRGTETQTARQRTAWRSFAEWFEIVRGMEWKLREMAVLQEKAPLMQHLRFAAAAALSARRPQTFANTGDWTTRHGSNPDVDQWRGTNALLILSSVPQSKRAYHPQCEMWAENKG